MREVGRRGGGVITIFPLKGGLIVKCTVFYAAYVPGPAR